jgi:heme-degrading monooxygenase HmoA
VILISAFEVTPDADDAFIVGWEQARELLASKGGCVAGALHRAWRGDAEFRFVDVARLESPRAGKEAVADPALWRGAMSFRAHPGWYEVIYEDGAPDGREGVVVINAFEVPANEDERFLAAWERARSTLTQRPGYLGTRLHRSLAAQTDFRFVDIARWSSPLAYSKATQRPEVQAAAEAMAYRSHPSLYQVIREWPAAG